MLGDFKLLEFYPRHWQATIIQSNHPWVLHITIWHYWLWFTFLFLMMLYFTYLIKLFSFNRADIKGIRSNFDKRRNAWSEILIIFFPFLWSINFVTHAFSYLKLIESNHSYSVINLHIIAYQWGWKYGYNTDTYIKVSSSAYEVGNNVTASTPGILYKNAYNSWIYKLNWLELKHKYNSFITRWVKLNIQNYYEIKLREVRTQLNQYEQYLKTNIITELTEGDVTGTRILESTVDSNTRRVLQKVWKYLRSSYLSTLSNVNKDKYKYIYTTKELVTSYSDTKHSYIEDSFDELHTNQNFYFNNYYENRTDIYVPQHTKWIIAQGVALNERIIHNGIHMYDPMRLLRSSGIAILPARLPICLLGTSQDVTHSWAIPSIGIKIDCVPGRLFKLYNIINREGIYFGQCAELCGINHYNMPVNLYVLSFEHFLLWWEIEFEELLKSFNIKYKYKNKNGAYFFNNKFNNM